MAEVISAQRVVGSAPGITWIAHDAGLVIDVGEGEPPRGTRELAGAVVVPGLIDLQVNGTLDVDFATASATAAKWLRATATLVAHGVTAFCPTFVSAPLASYDRYLASVVAARQAMSDEIVLGAHLEGPFLGGAPGAHDPELLAAADATWLAALVDRHPGLVRIVTLAPEADPDGEAIRALVARDVVVSLGHSTATYEQAAAAADAGARMATHLFNGMSPLHHREPGLVGLALDRLVPSVIADLVHVHPAALRTVIARKREIVVVSDQVAASGALGSAGPVESDDQVARLQNGTLAGSRTALDQAVRNLVSIGVPLERGVEMASTIPAELLGLSDRGRIAPGYRADFVALDAATLSVRETWIGGVRQGVAAA